ncbi:hypothetical protein RHSIM_Rhsim04G0052600 [Rhododendron simsii]|uniref:Endoplasmic reticulum transmembrane protein n=1 Tax=Rhododendron simsii TaxID=118357 RepID=A0A834H390_RHOSS|nr:hypothetical protein RHSIM_Rhsim04G0052600 [Rhododendron simsii]
MIQGTIQLLLTHILIELFIEMALALSLVFETPLQKLAIAALDRLNQGSRRLVILTAVEGILVVILMTVRDCLIRGDSVDALGQFLVADKALRASLLGFLPCLSMMRDKLHQLVREHSSLNQMILSEEKQLAERKLQNAKSLKALEKRIAPLKTMIKKLELEYERKAKHANTAKAKEMALMKQTEEFELEYDRLLEYNEILRNQLQSIDESSLMGNPKRGWSSLKSNLLGEGLLQLPWGTHNSIKNSSELGPEIDVQTCNQSAQYLCSGCHHAGSLPRHRRPIYQQMSFTL